MPAVIFNGTKVKTLKKTISLFNGAEIISGTDNPTLVATAGNRGSLYLDETTGKHYSKSDNGTTTNWLEAGGGGGGASAVRFTLDGAVVPFVSIDGLHYQSVAESLSTVSISALGTGSSGSTVIQVNQYRAGALFASSTASLAANAGLPGGTATALSAPLVLAVGDVLSVDVNSMAVGASDLTVAWSAAGVGGGVIQSVAIKTGNYTMTNTDDIILVNATSAATITMHSAATALLKNFRIKNIGTATVTVALDGADTIDGDTSVILPAGGTPQTAIDLISGGTTAWYIF